MGKSYPKSVLNYKKILSYLLVVFVPVIISSLFLFFNENHPTIFSVMPSWNDEDLYFNELKSVLEFGRPLGYFGFDGSHAPVGTFDAHGWFILIPYVIIAKLFGLHFFTVSLTNHILIMLAILVYLCLFKPEFKQGMIICLLLFSPMVLFYLGTSMVEGSNYFYGIIAAVLFVHVIKNNGKLPSKVFLFIICCFATLSKPSWAVLFFPLSMVLLEKKVVNNKIRVFISALFTLVGTGIGYMFFHTFVADYFDETYAINIFFEGIKTNGLIRAMFYLLKQFVQNLYITFFSLYDSFREISKIYIVAVLLLSFFLMIMYKAKNHTYIPFLFLLASICGVVLLYLPGEVAIRAVYPASVFSFTYLIIDMDYTEKSRLSYTTKTFAIICLMFTFVLQIKGHMPQRIWFDKEEAIIYEEIENKMRVVEVNKDAINPWDNTLAIHVATTFNHRIPEMLAPAGVGINFYQSFVDSNKPLNAGYVLVFDNSPDLDYLVSNGYEKISDSFYDIIILKRQDL